MINSDFLNTMLSESDKSLEELKKLIAWKSNFYVFPFTIQGCINVTETGIKPEALEINDYTYFSKVISGEYPIIATWDKSTKWIGKSERFWWMQEELGATKKYDVGRFFKGVVEEDLQGLRIGSNESAGIKMTNLQAEEKITILTTEKIKKEDIFKLYIIKHWDIKDYDFVSPEMPIKNIYDKNSVQFLYIFSCQTFYNTKGNFIYASISFASLNDALSDSGYSIANYVQLSLPGGGFAFPMLKQNAEGKIEVVLDALRTIDIGIWGLQIKIDNTAIFHSIRVMGHPTKWEPVEENPTIPSYKGYSFAPRPLLVKYFLPTSNHPLNTNLKAEENYALVAGIEPVIDFYIGWLDHKKTSYDETIKNTYEGHLRTDYDVTKSSIKHVPIWKNALYTMGSTDRETLPEWPLFIGKRTIINSDKWGFEDLNTSRSAFYNIFDKRYPKWMGVNKKLVWGDVVDTTAANIINLNMFANHDIINLPISMRQTISVEESEGLDQGWSGHVPIIGGIWKRMVKGWNNMFYGKIPRGFKEGGFEELLKYMGKGFVGFMSEEMYLFYTGEYAKAEDQASKGIISFNAFQTQDEDPLTTLLSARSNTTALNFKISDICKASIYDMAKSTLKPERWEYVSTVHIRQNPGIYDRDYGQELPWKDTETVLIDNFFSVTVDPREPMVMYNFGDDIDNKRLYVLHEIAFQVIGGGNVTITAFAADPSTNDANEVSVWEGKFRNYAANKKTTRAWTTTIRFGQPKIETEDGKDYQYHYPRTILSDIQKRPNLPPDIFHGDPKETHHLGLFIVNYDNITFNIFGDDRYFTKMIETTLIRPKTESKGYFKTYFSFGDTEEHYNMEPMMTTYEKHEGGLVKYYHNTRGNYASLFHHLTFHELPLPSYWEEELKEMIQELQANKPLYNGEIEDWEDGIAVNTIWNWQTVILSAEVMENGAFSKEIWHGRKGDTPTFGKEKLPAREDVKDIFKHGFLEDPYFEDLEKKEKNDGKLKKISVDAYFYLSLDFKERRFINFDDYFESDE